jgi:proteic killer suppression protein
MVDFADQGTADLFHRRKSKAARGVIPVSLQRVAIRKLDMVNQAHALDDLRVPPGNRLEALHGDREGQHSIRINDQYRVCFEWRDGSARAVEIFDYHSPAKEKRPCP